MEHLDTLPFKGKKELFTKLERLATIVNLNKKERAEYEESLKIYRDNQGVLDFALKSGYDKGKEEGREEGLAEGKAEGLAEGEAKGEAKGKQEGKAEIAAALKQSGMDMQSISRYTGLTAEEIGIL